MLTTSGVHLELYNHNNFVVFKLMIVDSISSINAIDERIKPAGIALGDQVFESRVEINARQVEYSGLQVD